RVSFHPSGLLLQAAQIVVNAEVGAPYLDGRDGVAPREKGDVTVEEEVIGPPGVALGVQLAGERAVAVSAVRAGAFGTECFSQENGFALRRDFLDARIVVKPIHSVAGLVGIVHMSLTRAYEDGNIGVAGRGAAGVGEQ